MLGCFSERQAGRRPVCVRPNRAIRPLRNSSAPVDSEQQKRASGAPAGADDSLPGWDHSRGGGGELLPVVGRKIDLSSLEKLQPGETGERADASGPGGGVRSRARLLFNHY